MLDTGELSDFISFAAENYPANRISLSFGITAADHFYGYGYDEMYPETRCS
jgi:hypothetical protein